MGVLHVMPRRYRAIKSSSIAPQVLCSSTAPRALYSNTVQTALCSNTALSALPTEGSNHHHGHLVHQDQRTAEYVGRFWEGTRHLNRQSLLSKDRHRLL